MVREVPASIKTSVTIETSMVMRKRVMMNCGSKVMLLLLMGGSIGVLEPYFGSGRNSCPGAPRVRSGLAFSVMAPEAPRSV